MEGRINRIVVDEAHKVFIEESFRSSFLRIKDLAQFPVQKIFLSATLPPFLQEYFFQLTALPSSTLIIRASTSRPNLRYHAMVVEPQIKSAENLAKELTNFLEEKTFEELSRGIIYCTDILTTDALADSIVACKSHSKMSAQELWQHQGMWKQGVRKWMVATTGFLHGIDYPDVRAVIFANIPYGSLNIEQGAGRAGRNGQVANIFVLHPLNQVWIGANHQYRSTDEDPQCLTHAVDWVEAKTDCRRFGMSLLMDGQGTSCNDLAHAVKCDVCGPDDPIVAVPKKLSCTSSTSHSLEGAPSHVDWDMDRDAGPNPPEMDTIDNYYQPSSISTAANFSSDKGKSPLLSQRARLTSVSSMSTRAKPQETSSSLSFPESNSCLQLGSSHITLHGSTGSSSTAFPSKNPSMAIKVDAAIFMKNAKTLHQKVDILSTMANYLKGSCYICWAKKGELVTKTPDHKFFVDCRRPEDSRFVENATGWWGMKKKFWFAKFEYCYWCGLPQGKYHCQPHPPVGRDGSAPCQFDDLVAVLAWFVFMDPPTYAKACAAFAALRMGMTVEEFTNWGKKKADGKSFYNALELVIWFWIQKQK